MAAHADLRGTLRAEGLEDRFGHIGRRGSVADLVDEFQANANVADNPDAAPRVTT